MIMYFSEPTTYGRLSDVLSTLGFNRRISPSQYNERLGYQMPAAVVYEHEEAGALIILPVLAPDAKLNGAHRAVAASTVYDFGVFPSKAAFNVMLTEEAQIKAAAPERGLVEAAAGRTGARTRTKKVKQEAA